MGGLNVVWITITTCKEGLQSRVTLIFIKTKVIDVLINIEIEQLVCV